MKIILLIMIGISILNADFTKSGDTVTDSVSKLEWQDDSATESATWVEAIEKCESLNHSDWRLPNINELKSIVDRSKENPAIVETFQNNYSSNYWSSTTYEGSSDYAWFVDFFYGSVYGYDKSGNGYVRCVRGGQ